MHHYAACTEQDHSPPVCPSEWEKSCCPIAVVAEATDILLDISKRRGDVYVSFFIAIKSMHFNASDLCYHMEQRVTELFSPSDLEHCLAHRQPLRKASCDIVASVDWNSDSCCQASSNHIFLWRRQNKFYGTKADHTDHRLTYFRETVNQPPTHTHTPFLMGLVKQRVTAPFQSQLIQYTYRSLKRLLYICHKWKQCPQICHLSYNAAAIEERLHSPPPLCHRSATRLQWCCALIHLWVFSGTSGVGSCCDSLMIMNCRLGPVPFSNALWASRLRLQGFGWSLFLSCISQSCMKTIVIANLCAFCSVTSRHE